MKTSGSTQSIHILFSRQESAKAEKGEAERIRKTNHIADRNLQTPSSETKIHDKRLLSHLSDFNDLITSAENGKAEAQFSLAMAYFEGIFVDRNFDEGEKWLVKAAKNGHNEAKRELHAIYFQGDGIVDG